MEPRNDCIRILVLGDSFTEGAGVDEVEQTFPKIMEKALNEHPAAAGRKFQVVNAGWGGSFTAQWVDLFRFLQPRFEPDLVLAVFFTRDGTFIGAREFYFERIRAEILSKIGWLDRVSGLFRKRKNKELQQWLSNRSVETYLKSYAGSPAETVEWRVAQENLSALQASVTSSGAQFALVNFPVLFDLTSTHPLQAVYQIIQAFSAHEGIPYIDLFPALEGKSYVDLWVSPDDQHPNERAHKLVGQYLAKILRPGFTWAAS
jgi:lysophospholipase L1-like esterase